MTQKKEVGRGSGDYREFYYGKYRMRTVVEEKRVFFSYVDVEKIFPKSLLQPAISRLQQSDVHRIKMPTRGGEQSVLCISIDGLYHALGSGRFKTEKVQELWNWCRTEALPFYVGKTSVSMLPEPLRFEESAAESAPQSAGKPASVSDISATASKRTKRQKPMEPSPATRSDTQEIKPEEMQSAHGEKFEKQAEGAAKDEFVLEKIDSLLTADTETEKMVLSASGVTEQNENLYRADITVRLLAFGTGLSSKMREILSQKAADLLLGQAVDVLPASTIPSSSVDTSMVQDSASYTETHIAVKAGVSTQMVRHVGIAHGFRPEIARKDSVTPYGRSVKSISTTGYEWFYTKKGVAHVIAQIEKDKREQRAIEAPEFFGKDV